MGQDLQFEPEGIQAIADMLKVRTTLKAKLGASVEACLVLSSPFDEFYTLYICHRYDVPGLPVRCSFAARKVIVSGIVCGASYCILVLHVPTGEHGASTVGPRTASARMQ